MATLTFGLMYSADDDVSNETGTITSEAVDEIEVKALKNSVAKHVALANVDIASIKAISIESDNYVSLTYKVDGRSPIPLDAPLTLVTLGTIANFFGVSCTALEFDNSDATNDANITIMVARNVTPYSPPS